MIKCIPKLKVPLINIKFCGRTNLYVSNILLIISPNPKIIFFGIKNNNLIIKFAFIIEIIPKIVIIREPNKNIKTDTR
jgi:hypothetical protein